MSDIDIRNNEAAGRFEVELGGETAYAEYRVLETGVLFPHTEVPAAFEGRGVGSALVRAGLDFARERGLLIIPVCPFFAAWVARHPEAHDLVHPHYRKALGLE